jgi:hypothetical protein
VTHFHRREGDLFVVTRLVSSQFETVLKPCFLIVLGSEQSAFVCMKRETGAKGADSSPEFSGRWGHDERRFPSCFVVTAATRAPSTAPARTRTSHGTPWTVD